MTTPSAADAQRYPVGRFTYDGDDSNAARAARINVLAELPAQLAASVRGLSPEQLDTPYREGGWTVRQVVHHVPDSHVNAYVRFKLALTETAPTIVPYDEAAWARLSDVRDVPIETSLVLLDALHARWVAVLRGMTDADFARTYVHPEHGRTFTLDEVLAMYAWHSKHHLAHVQNLRERMGWS